MTPFKQTLITSDIFIYILQLANLASWNFTIHQHVAQSFMSPTPCQPLYYNLGQSDVAMIDLAVFWNGPSSG